MTVTNQEFFFFRISLEKAIKNAKNKELSLELIDFSNYLIENDPIFEKIFSKDRPRLNRKILKTLLFLKQKRTHDDLVKSITSINATHASFADVSNFNLSLFKEGLIYYVKSCNTDNFTDCFYDAWSKVLDYIIDIMNDTQPKEITSILLDQDFLESIGGEEKVNTIHKHLYDYLFEDRWLGQYFYGKNKQTLIRKQTEFVMSMAGLSTGSLLESPYTMHMHMFINEEVYNVRQEYLRRSLIAENMGVEQIQVWIDFDNAFREAIEKKLLKNV